MPDIFLTLFYGCLFFYLFAFRWAWLEPRHCPDHYHTAAALPFIIWLEAQILFIWQLDCQGLDNAITWFDNFVRHYMCGMHGIVTTFSIFNYSLLVGLQIICACCLLFSIMCYILVISIGKSLVLKTFVYFLTILPTLKSPGTTSSCTNREWPWLLWPRRHCVCWISLWP